MSRPFVFQVSVCFILISILAVRAIAVPPELVSVKKIWDRAPHSAFTDLIRFEGKWYCTFREAESHAGSSGKIRVLVSDDGEKWDSAAVLIEEGTDLRDPKLSIMPDGRLMLICCGSLYERETYLTRAPRAAFSKDGCHWTVPRRVLAEDHWLWRVTWHEGTAWSLSKMGEGTNPRRGFLYSSPDGIHWNWITEFKLEGVSETTIRFLPDDEMAALIRPGYIGTSKPPYKQWTFHKMKYKIGGPNFIRAPDGTLWASGRMYNSDGTRTTVLAEMTRKSYKPVLTLPSGGDTSYPGMFWYDGLLWISYYSSHEGKTCIYLAKIRL